MWIFLFKLTRLFFPYFRFHLFNLASLTYILEWYICMYICIRADPKGPHASRTLLPPSKPAWASCWSQFALPVVSLSFCPTKSIYQKFLKSDLWFFSHFDFLSPTHHRRHLALGVLGDSPYWRYLGPVLISIDIEEECLFSLIFYV